MTVEQSPLEQRFPNQKSQSQPPILKAEKDSAESPTPGVIDLTNDPDKEDDLKKAIALSLKEHDERVLGGQVTMEDQDISRVVEASLAESKAVGTKRKRGEVWQDPLNPHDRKRNGDWPVGLKNVGNTCWFSAVIQSLFHLPIFRRLVLSYALKEWDMVAPDGKEKTNLIMQELRKLFALLLCSKRKYVDPSHALEELKEAFPDSNGTDSQQDVSEFSHKLLEWLEEAFKMNSYSSHSGDNGESMMEGSEQNPMLDLFYGHCLSEGLNEGRTFCNEETFGQYPLQVNGFANIHESLEAAMSQDIESYDVLSKSGQESWFTRLPPVLLFELSRFQFNQQLGRTEKIHNKLDFPEIMFMDRYMEQNKSTTRSIREKVRRLKAERHELQIQLEKYLNYGTGPKKVPLCDVLQYTLDFAESKKCNEDITTTEDVEMESAESVSSCIDNMGGDSPCASPKAISLEQALSPMHPGGICRTPVRRGCEQVNHNCEETVPSPQHVSEIELKVLQNCLKRWQKEIEINVKSLQDNIAMIDNTIKEIYNNPFLQQKPYRLHAVLVHEGQAASGHYWAYVFSPRKKLWLKFNDVTVSEAKWSELQKDSLGGHNYASAYCLLYVDEKRPELFDEGDFELGPEQMFALPEDLRLYIEDDTEAFQLEIEHWDYEQSQKKDSSTMTANDGDCTIIAEKRMILDENSTSRFFSELSMEHAALMHKATVKRIEQTKMAGHSPAEIFAELLRTETSRLRRLARLPATTDDSRLQHIGAYILTNSQSPEPHLTWSILEQFLVPELDDFQKGRLVKEAAILKLETLQHSFKDDHFENYNQWHLEYQKFRRMVSLFVVGVDSYHNQKNYHNALTYFTCCCQLNSALLNLPGDRRGLDAKLLQHYRRHSALKLNEIVASQFEALDPKGALEALSTAYESILPSMEFLTSPNAAETDIEVAEIIRNRWCSMLGYDIASKQSPKQERLQDFLSKLLDPGNDLPKPNPSTLMRVANLEEKYQAALNLAIKSGEFEASQRAK
ncbi:ubiquitin carboxyl-terminal hydrolase 25-like [Uloborus diversus]|uniref:ubiquitin carboxyl-terminal hydrolase 25-like n=1 Tax=Uloborus diversus TaxID=327109 RepID=UPI00240939B0|nr:ubiquitin carboxyl-terminal hydrolase 25-like [Uloborus diversus]